MNYDIIIIGGGAAGMSAAIYAGRGGMKTLLIEKLSFGGQMMNTYEIDNYPALFDGPSGDELSKLMEKHAKKYGTDFTSENVKEIICNDIKTVKTRKNEYSAKAIIYAAGAVPKKLGVPGEAELTGAGVSYCATCDGAFFKDKDVVVIGGGNTAFEDALYLSKICKTVYMLNRSERFRAAAVLVDKAKDTKNIKILTNTVATSFEGNGMLEAVCTKNTKTNETGRIDVSGTIIAVGVSPNSETAKECGIKTDENGFIETDKYLKTNIDGIFAAGDVRTTPLRQVITAAADGAVAAVSAINFINTAKI